MPQSQSFILQNVRPEFIFQVFDSTADEMNVPRRDRRQLFCLSGLRNHEHSPKDLRQHVRGLIARKDYESLFTGGACYFFALVLHEKLELPLYYASPPDADEYAHVFVMRDGKCVDFVGPHDVTEIAERYAGWQDEPPKLTNRHKILEKIEEKAFGAEPKTELFQIAREQFETRRERYIDGA